MGIIYILENKINGKCYVGKTIQPFNKRLRRHLKDEQIIDKSIRKYGMENFKITTMNCFNEYLNWMEKEWIKEINSLNPNGYNLTKGGDGGGVKGRAPWNKGKTGVYSKEHLKKMSEIKMGENNPLYKIPHTEEWKKMMSEKMSGENNPFFGLTHSKKSRKKQSIAKLGKKRGHYNK